MLKMKVFSFTISLYKLGLSSSCENKIKFDRENVLRLNHSIHQSIQSNRLLINLTAMNDAKILEPTKPTPVGK